MGSEGEWTLLECLRDAIYTSGQSNRGDSSFKTILERIALRASRGLKDEHLAKLINIWLSSNLSLRNWSSLGNCLIPERRVPDSIIDYVIRWLRCNYYNTENPSRVVYVLGWLQGLIDYGLLNLEMLDIHYDFFTILLNIDKYSAIASRFVYLLSKPHDVTRLRVLFLLKLTKKEKSPKFCNSIYAILNLFKSFKPDLAPETVPAVSISSVFPKVNKTLATALQQAQTRCSIQTALISENRIVWWKQSSMDNKNKNSILIPNIEYVHVRSSLYSSENDPKKCIEFESAKDLMLYNLGQSLETPANVLSLLINETTLHLLMFADDSLKSRFLYNLYHTLHNNYLKNSSFSYQDKKVFLKRIVNLQNFLLQGLHVVSRFLAIFISDWNGHDFFDEILSLLEWVTFENFEELYDCILEHIECLYVTNNVYYQCAIVNMLKRLYMRIFQKFSSSSVDFFPSRGIKYNEIEVLSNLADFIKELCDKSSNNLYGNAMLRYAFLDAYSTICNLQVDCEHPLFSFPPVSLVYGVLCSPSSYSIDRMLNIILKYELIYERDDLNNKKDTRLISLLNTYVEDYSNCLWYGESIKGRNKGLLLNMVHPKLLEYMENDMLEEYESLLDIGHHIAFANYTYLKIPVDKSDLDKTILLQALIAPYFVNLANLVEKIT